MKDLVTDGGEVGVCNADKAADEAGSGLKARFDSAPTQAKLINNVKTADGLIANNHIQK